MKVHYTATVRIDDDTARVEVNGLTYKESYDWADTLQWHVRRAVMHLFSVDSITAVTRHPGRRTPSGVVAVFSVEAVA